MSNKYYMKQSAIKECLLVRKNAIARNTMVGATLYTDDTFISGWNIENRIHKGYHAEELAILNARLRGINPKEIEGIVVSFSQKDISKLTFMCGFCRQMIWEFTFNPDLLVTEVDLDGKIVAEKTLGELYPHPFPLEEFKLVSIKKQLREAAKRNSEILKKLENDSEFLEEMEEFQRKISYISPEDRMRVFDI